MASEPLLGSVLVTGGCGFIGHNIVSYILEQEPTCKISVLDINTAKNRLPSVGYYECDISVEGAVQSVFDAIDPPLVVIHTACPPSMTLNAARFEQVNVVGTHNLLKCIRKLDGVRALVYTSSSAVTHREHEELIDADESLPILKAPEQDRVYTLTKAMAEELVYAANRTNKLLTCVVRPCLTFGEGDYGYFAKVLSVAETGRARFQMGEGKNLFDFVYVGNVAHAHVLAARNLLKASQSSSAPSADAERIDGQAINITNGESIPFWSFTLRVAEVSGHAVKPSEIWVIPQSVGLAMGFLSEWIVWLVTLGRKESNLSRAGVRFTYLRRTLSIEKAKRVLEYKPPYSLSEGIERSVSWFRNQQ